MPADSETTDPELSLLTGADVDDLLAATLARAGGRVLRWSLRDVDHRPGSRTTATYVARVAWPDGEREETLGASVRTGGSTQLTPPGQDRLIVTDGEHVVEMWRFPFDPELPALAAASIPAAASAMLGNLGVDTADLTLRVVSYRPRRRAVVEVTTRSTRLFLKVLRPRTLAEVRRRHLLLAEAGLPIAHVRGHSDDGLLVLEALDGAPMRSALDRHGARASRPDDLIRLLDHLPEEVRHLPRRTPWAAHAAHYADVIAASTPDDAGRVRALAADIDGELAQYGEGDEPTHGDFYEAQLMVADGHVTGLLDIDTVGPGRRADDLACMIAHLSVLTAMEPDATHGVRDALGRWQAEFERRVSPHELRARTAGVVLSLATGPFRAQEPGWARATADRVALAERWLESAGQGATGAL
ncbi:MAG: phosphotransferase [Jiangellaceae bacterium]